MCFWVLGKLVTKKVRDFHCKPEMRIYGIDVLEELVTVFSLLDDEGVFHVLKPEPGWIGAELMALASNSYTFINKITVSLNPVHRVTSRISNLRYFT